MNHKQVTMKRFLIILLLIVCSPMRVSAETVYNFYFNPETTSQKASVAPAPQTETAASDVTKNSSMFCINKYIGYDCKNEVWKVSAYATGFLGNGREIKFKTGKYMVRIGEKNTEKNNIEDGAVGMGGTLAIKYFPNRSIGIFGNVISYNQHRGEDFVFAAGTEFIPIHIPLFGINNLIDIGAEIGWSNYKDWNNKDSYKYEMMSWFGGGFTNFNFTKYFSIDLGLRRSLRSVGSLQPQNWMANAGLSYKF